MYSFVITGAAITVNGYPITLSIGDVWDANDPVVKDYPAFFTDTPDNVRRSVPVKTAAKKIASKK